MSYTKEEFFREVRHTGGAIALALLFALAVQLDGAADFGPVFTVGFAVTVARTIVTVAISIYGGGKS